MGCLFYENPQKGRQIYLYLKKKKRSEISTGAGSSIIKQNIKEKNDAASTTEKACKKWL